MRVTEANVVAGDDFLIEEGGRRQKRTTQQAEHGGGSRKEAPQGQRLNAAVRPPTLLNVSQARNLSGLIFPQLKFLF